MSTFSRQGGERATDEVKLDCLGFALDEYEAERALRHGHSCPAPAGARVAARVWAIGKDMGSRGAHSDGGRSESFRPS